MKPARLIRIYRSRAMRRRAYELLDDGTWTRFGAFFHQAIIVLVIASVAAVVFETVPSIQERYGRLLDLIELVAIIVFTMEYAARLWCSTEHPPYRHMTASQARVAYLLTPTSIIDLLAVLPFYLAFLFESDLKVFILFRLLRFFKLARYSPVMQTLFDAVLSERRALLGCLYILVSLALVSASIMHLVEREAQPDKLGTIPDAMYWAVVTLTTVGYGDVSPVTPLGKVVASVTALAGIVMLALPVGIIATSFSQAIQRRAFVVTWSMVAHVPMFAKLSAADVAELMRYLQSQTAEENEVIVRRGDVAHSMYFVASGQVEVDLITRTVTLGEGDFFGEMAVIRQTRRSATIRAVTKTKLLVLDAADLRGLIERRPEIGRLIEAEAASRRLIDDLDQDGDLAPSEIADR
ncbi:cyclic nucleotide-gated ion channel [Terrarubrum flagellatum]|uniref:cyclic nucleotide-gated ion channel n=1 Tax=Terrirubrum flagellatum TaxID=2895980 RepID=UPI0031455C52